MKLNHYLEALYRDISSNKLAFFAIFLTVVTLTYALLYIIDFIPEPVNAENTKSVSALGSVTGTVLNIVRRVNGGLVPTEQQVADIDPTDSSGVRVVIPEEVVPDSGELPAAVVAKEPQKIIFDNLDGKTISVLNPTSRTVADLDEALLSGVVRHPDSADFVNTGNIFILGHSSYLPNVFNKNFQAFNEIQSLTWGDTIRLQSSDTEYVYQVDRVYKASASALEVPNSRGVAKLTLATCNSFGSKDDRFIVEATLISQKTL